MNPMPGVKVHAAGARGAHARLAHRQFFGRFQREADVAGFSLARVEADPHNDVQRHTHDTAHFIFVIKGPYISSAAGAPDVCSVPTLIYNPPGTTHRDRFQRKESGGFDGRFLSIAIAPQQMGSLLDAGSMCESPFRVASPECATLAVRAVRELDAWEPLSRLVLEGICLELAASVGRHDAPGSSGAPGWLRSARELLHDHAAETLSMSDIARACGVHAVHLARTFRRFHGCSPGAYLRRNRIVRAAEQLRRGDQSLADVALQCGFADQSHMTRAFQRALSLTPAAYRRQSGAGAAPPSARLRPFKT